MSLVMAIPDHPWTKATKDAAAVRIAMTVAERGSHQGELREVTLEEGLDSDEPKIVLSATHASIHPNLTSGVDVGSAVPLKANAGLSVRGVEFHGKGYVIDPHTRDEFHKEAPYFVQKYVKPFIATDDIKSKQRTRFVIDIHRRSEREVRQIAPSLYQHLLTTARPTRASNPVKRRRDEWWKLALPHTDLRNSTARLREFIATPVTAKHRWFVTVPGEFRPDQSIMVIASDDRFVLGVLQSILHLTWALSVGGTLEDRPRYNNTTCFDPFPFPDPTPEQRAAIAELAEELDATRKAALAETDKLTMTELYNLREKLRTGAEMDDKEQRRATKARAAIVNRLHEQLDQAVADAYGWGEEWRSGALGPSEIVARLVALNHERAAEEKAGKVRWLRPDYQVPRFGRAAE